MLSPAGPWPEVSRHAVPRGDGAAGPRPAGGARDAAGAPAGAGGGRSPSTPAPAASGTPLALERPSRPHGAGGVVLYGPTEWRHKLALRPLEAIRQRVTVACPLPPLTAAEAGPYGAHQLQPVRVDPRSSPTRRCKPGGMGRTGSPGASFVGLSLLHGRVCRPTHRRRPSSSGRCRVTPGPSGRSPVRGDVRVGSERGTRAATHHETLH